MVKRRLVAKTLSILCVVLGVIAVPAGARTPALAQNGAALAGRLLVASEDMGDPRFAETVLYVMRHDSSGAMAVVVNRPVAETPLAALLDALGRESDGVTGTVRIHYGGPVQLSTGFVLHTSDWTRRDSLVVPRGLALTTDPEVLDAIAHGHGPRRALFALGYAGWAPGQLEAEIAQGVWITIDADEALVFGEDASTKWKRALDRRKIDL